MKTRPTPIVFGALLVFVAFGAATACSSTSAEGGAPFFSSSESSRVPMTEGDCLDGEYFDRATESCEPLEPGDPSRTLDSGVQMDIPAASEAP